MACDETPVRNDLNGAFPSGGPPPGASQGGAPPRSSNGAPSTEEAG
jgi:hypothetical protein